MPKVTCELTSGEDADLRALLNEYRQSASPAAEDAVVAYVGSLVSQVYREGQLKDVKSIALEVQREQAWQRRLRPL